VTLFWVSAVILVAIALAILLPSLLRSRTVSTDAQDLNIALARERMRSGVAKLPAERSAPKPRGQELPTECRVEQRQAG